MFSGTLSTVILLKKRKERVIDNELIKTRPKKHLYKNVLDTSLAF